MTARTSTNDATEDPKPATFADTLRATVAGGEAVKVFASAVALFDAGGRRLLSESTRDAVRRLAERGAESAFVVAATGIPSPAALTSGGPAAALVPRTARGVVLAAGAQTARLAAKEVLRGAGRAAGAGFVIDGAFAGVQAALAMRRGATDAKTAAAYVAREATTGAIATAAGVLIGAALVAVTGGMATPVVFAVSALGAVGTKRLFGRRARGPRFA